MRFKSKILALVLLAAFAYSNVAHAAVEVNTRRLTSSTGSSITALALTSGVAVNSEAVKVSANVGYMSILATEAHSGGTGDVDIYAEWSLDGTNWYRANTTSSGSLTQDSNIVTALSNGTKWITFTARLARYVRIVFDPDADSVVTADLIYQEEI